MLFRSDIPILGLAFQRNTDDTAKIDLLIFITAKIAGEETVVQGDEPKFEPEHPGPDTQIKWQHSQAPDAVRVNMLAQAQEKK